MVEMVLERHVHPSRALPLDKGRAQRDSKNDPLLSSGLGKTTCTPGAVSRQVPAGAAAESKNEGIRLTSLIVQSGGSCPQSNRDVVARHLPGCRHAQTRIGSHRLREL